jgi:hypothetical protein
MVANNILVAWLLWHFYEAPRFLLKVWGNFLRFSANFFSTPLLLKTFFSPWRRYHWSYPRSIDVKEYANVFISNTFSRVLGAICRIVLIIFGIVFQVFVAVAGAIIFVGWIILPLILLALLLFSFGFFY